jgi:hypothetical protein
MHAVQMASIDVDSTSRNALQNSRLTPAVAGNGFYVAGPDAAQSGSGAASSLQVLTNSGTASLKPTRDSTTHWMLEYMTCPSG